MTEFERDVLTSQPETDSQHWFTQPGPTESFLRTAPEHLLEVYRRTAPSVTPDPTPFTVVGPTPGFAGIG